MKNDFVMGAVAIRKKLQEYIRIADDKKVKAIYTILENENYSTHKEVKKVLQNKALQMKK